MPSCLSSQSHTSPPGSPRVPTHCAVFLSVWAKLPGVPCPLPLGILYQWTEPLPGVHPRTEGLASLFPSRLPVALPLMPEQGSGVEGQSTFRSQTSDEPSLTPCSPLSMFLLCLVQGGCAQLSPGHPWLSFSSFGLRWGKASPILALPRAAPAPAAS